MPLLVVNCHDNSSKTFYKATIKLIAAVYKDKQEFCVTSIEEAKGKRKNSLVLGNIVKLISYGKKSVVILVQEVLCNSTYGGRFIAILYNQLAVEFINLKPVTGNQVAFFEAFVFENPSLPKNNCNVEKLPKHILEIGDSIIIYAQKKNDFGPCVPSTLPTVLHTEKKNSFERCEQYISSEEKKLTSTHMCTVNAIDKMDIQDGVKMQERRKPSINLPVNPQIPDNTKRLNPQYKYTTIKDVKSSADSGNFERANMFVVVKEIRKPLSNTSSGKFTIICKVIDDSIIKKETTSECLDKGTGFNIHFFTVEDDIVKQIERGDIMRLHRVQIEIFNGDIDGRVFNSHDIMLFKNNSNDARPVTVAKKTLFTDDDKTRVYHLRNWYNDVNSAVTLLENIRQEGMFNIRCKVIADPTTTDQKVLLKITDGSDTRHFETSIPLKRSQGKSTTNFKHATVIEMLQAQGEMPTLKSGVCIHVNEVKANINGSKLKLCVHNPSALRVLDETSNENVEIQKRIESLNIKINVEDNELQTTNHKYNSDQIDKQPSQNYETSIAMKDETNVDSHYFCNKGEVDVNFELKPRKALFSANYADLSDATEDDTLEILEALNNLDHENALKEDVTPANTSFGDLIDLVKSKYCSPRKLSKEEEQLECPLSKVANCGKEHCQEDPKVYKEEIARRTSFRKKRLSIANEKNNRECLEDANTVINVSCQKNVLNRVDIGNKKLRLEPKLIVFDDGLISSSSVLPTRCDSLVNWLLHPFNKHTDKIRRMSAIKGIDVREITHLLHDEDKKTSAHINFAESPFLWCQFFLIEVFPDPSSEALDLVSGFCNEGCQQFFLFSTIEWDFNRESVPHCPICIREEQKRELELMFLMEMHVMTTHGFHCSVTVIRENAELFLGCSTNDFLTDRAIRKSRIQILNDCILQNTMNSSHTPLLNLSVVLHGKILFLIDSKLKLPSAI